MNQEEQYDISQIIENMNKLFLKVMDDDMASKLHELCKGYNDTCICIRSGRECPKEKELKLKRMKEILQ